LQQEDIRGAKPAWRILVVDDEPAISSLMKVFLERDGHSVQTASNGQEALLLLEQQSFDLVTTDYSMSGMKGDLLAAAIKKRLPKMPVLMISSKGAVAKACGDPLPGVDMVMAKPFNMEDLRKAMAEVLSKVAGRLP
jgi:two-component system response regulator FlrC